MTPTPDRAAMAGPADCVTLRLGEGHYALPLAAVVEVLRMVRLTPFPEGPPWVVGMLNLRGVGVAVVDLRRRLGLPPREPDPDMAILIVEVDGRPLGLLADEALEVVALAPEPIARPEGEAGPAPLVPAVAHLGDRSVLLLDPARLRADTPCGGPPA